MRQGNESSSSSRTNDRTRDNNNTETPPKSTQPGAGTMFGGAENSLINALTSISQHMSGDKELKESLRDTVALLAKRETEDKKRKRSSKTDEEQLPILHKGDFPVEDDSQESIDMKARQLFKGPNNHPEVWWRPEKMDEITTPVVGRGLFLSHLMPGRINEVTLRKLHDRSELSTAKMLSSENSNLTGDKTPRQILDRDQESDKYFLASGRNYREPKTVREVVEAVLNFCAAIHQIRPYSYEGLALLRGLHHVNFFFGVTLDPKRQKELIEALLHEVFTYNQRRGAEKKYPATFKKIIELAKEVAQNNGISEANLISKSTDPYCGKRASGGPTKREQDLERKLDREKRKNSSYESNRTPRGGASGSKPSRGGFNGRQHHAPRGGGYGGRGNAHGAHSAHGAHGAYGNSFQVPHGGYNYQQHQGAPSKEANAEMVKAKLLETCMAFNSGACDDPNCAKKHLCSALTR